MSNDPKGLSSPKTPEGKAIKALYSVRGVIMVPKERVGVWRFFGRFGAFVVSFINAFATSGDAYYAARGLGHAPGFMVLAITNAIGTLLGFFGLYQPDIFSLFKKGFAKNSVTYQTLDSLSQALTVMDTMRLPYDARMDYLVKIWLPAQRDRAHRGYIRDYLKNYPYPDRKSLNDFVQEKNAEHNANMRAALKNQSKHCTQINLRAFFRVVDVLFSEKEGVSGRSIADQEKALANVLLDQVPGTGPRKKTIMNLFDKATLEMRQIRDMARMEPAYGPSGLPEAITHRIEAFKAKYLSSPRYTEEFRAGIGSLMENAFIFEKAIIDTEVNGSPSGIIRKARMERETWLKSKFSSNVADRIASEQRYRVYATDAFIDDQLKARIQADDHFQKGPFEKFLGGLGNFIGCVGAFANGALGFLGVCSLTGLTITMGIVSSPALLALAILGTVCMFLASYAMTRLKIVACFSGFGRWIDQGCAGRNIRNKTALFLSVLLSFTAGGGIAALALLAGKGLMLFLFSVLGVTPIGWLVSVVAVACLVSTLFGASTLLLPAVYGLMQKYYGIWHKKWTPATGARFPRTQVFFGKVRYTLLEMLGLNDRWHCLTTGERFGVVCSRLFAVVLILGCAVAQSVMAVSGWAENFGLLLVGAVLGVFVGITFFLVVASDMIKMVRESCESLYAMMCRSDCESEEPVDVLSASHRGVVSADDLVSVTVDLDSKYPLVRGDGHPSDDALIGSSDSELSSQDGYYSN